MSFNTKTKISIVLAFSAVIGGIGFAAYKAIEPKVKAANLEKTCDLFRMSAEGEKVYNAARLKTADGEKIRFKLPDGRTCAYDR